MTLMREMIVEWNFLSIGSIAWYSTPSMRYLITTSRSRVSTWMSEARRCRALKIVESTSLMIGEESEVSRSMRQRLLAGLLVLGDDLDPELLGRLLEHALGRLALLEDLLDRRLRADADADRRAEQQLELVDHQHVGRVGDDDLDRPRSVRRRGTKL